MSACQAGSRIFLVVKRVGSHTFSAMFRCLARLACALLLLVPHAEAARVADSLVRIQATSQEPNYRAPWSAGEVSNGVGAGFIINGHRILTNAHVVSNARFLAVSKEGDPKPYPAQVVHIGHDCDLALLTVDSPDFFKNTVALDFGGIPAIESTVSVYGYPIGGDRLSVTRGVVSRIDFQTYTHSGVDSHLAIQIDAAINPGNSGGPVLQDGKVVGVAFQGYSGDVAQNVGYMIPTPVIRRFLKDVEDGHYDSYMDLTISYHPLHNPAMRKALGLTDGDSGVFVGNVYGGGVSDGLLQIGDVLLAIDNLPIASDGTVNMDGEPVEMAEVVERKFKGDKVDFKVLRNGKQIRVTVPLTHAWPFSMQANAYNEKPRFVVFGGLVFQPVDANFIAAHNPDDLRLRYYFDHFISQNLYRERQEIVVLSNVLADPVNAYASEFRYDIVDKINDRKIQRIDDVEEALKQPADYYVIEMVGNERPLVLERKAVEEARERIRSRYRVTTEENLQK
jgi:S1-C subfamily serine protease